MSSDPSAPGPKEKLFASIGLILFFCGFFFLFLIADIYNKTFLPLSIALAIVIGAGVVITAFIFWILVPGKSRSIGFFIAIAFFNAFSLGSICLYILLLINFNKADKTHIVYRQVPFSHLEYYTHKGRLMAKVSIEIKDETKTYNIPEAELPRGVFRAFNIGIAPGHLGYDVIESGGAIK